jgi:hypothetical protein
MKRLKILCLTLLTLLVLGTTSIASAEEGVLEAGPFTGKSGVITHTTLTNETIQCTSSEGKGEFLKEKEKEKDQHGTGTVTLTGCTAVGFPINTLGDPAGTVKVNGLFLICLTEPKTLLFGVLVEAIGVVHGEIPILKELTLLKGAQIGSVSKAGEIEGKEFKGKNTEKDEAPRAKCTINGKEFTASYESSIDTKADIDTFLQGEGTITFTKEVKFMDK